MNTFGHTLSPGTARGTARDRPDFRSPVDTVRGPTLNTERVTTSRKLEVTSYDTIDRNLQAMAKPEQRDGRDVEYFINEYRQSN